MSWCISSPRKPTADAGGNEGQPLFRTFDCVILCFAPYAKSMLVAKNRENSQSNQSYIQSKNFLTRTVYCAAGEKQFLLRF